jgi:hypothetical protein
VDELLLASDVLLLLPLAADQEKAPSEAVAVPEPL